MDLGVRLFWSALIATTLVFTPALSQAQELSAEEAARIRAENIRISGGSNESSALRSGTQAVRFNKRAVSRSAVQAADPLCSGSCLISTLTGAVSGPAAPSQDFEFPGTELDTLEGQFFLADDLEVPDTPGLRGWIVESVQVEGDYRFSGNEDPPVGSSHTGVNLYFLPDEAGPDIGPEDSGITIYPPDNAFVDRNAVEAGFEDLPFAEFLPVDNGSFRVELPSSVYLERDTKYWLSVQSVGPFGFSDVAGSQWFWHQSNFGVNDGFIGGDDEGQVTEDNRSSDGSLLNSYVLTVCGGSTPADDAYWDVMSACGFFVGDEFINVGSGHATHPNLAYQLNGIALLAGYTVDPTALTVDEFGASDEFSVVLNLAPLPGATVTLPIESLDLTEGTVSPSSLDFTDANWDTPQIVTVTGKGDGIADGDQAFQVQVGAPQVTEGTDDEYAELGAQFVDVTNLDRVGGFTIDPTFLTVTEDGGTDEFIVVLNIAPNPGAIVTLPIASLDLTEGSVFPASLDFTDANWNVPQTVNVRGLSDDVEDGDQLFQVQVGPPQVNTGTDDDFAALGAQFVDVINLDMPPVQIVPTLNRYGYLLLVLSLLAVAGFRRRYSNQPGW